VISDTASGEGGEDKEDDQTRSERRKERRSSEWDEGRRGDVGMEHWHAMRHG